jgi:hypothetical protein
MTPATQPLLGRLPHGGTPAQFIGIVCDQPDEQSAIKQTIEEFKVPANQRDRLIAQPRD